MSEHPLVGVIGNQAEQSPQDEDAGQAIRILDRTGHLAQQPPLWAAIAAALAVADPERGRRAALRGAVCYALAGVVANLVIKPVVHRERPPKAGTGRIGPLTSSFPSGHAATDVAFTFGAAQVLPSLFLPLGLAAATAHWSLIRTRGHYASDVFAGGALGVAVVVVVWKTWPTHPANTTVDKAVATTVPVQQSAEDAARNEGTPSVGT